jgi:hypothetical protein
VIDVLDIGRPTTATLMVVRHEVVETDAEDVGNAHGDTQGEIDLPFLVAMDRAGFLVDECAKFFQGQAALLAQYPDAELHACLLYVSDNELYHGKIY